MLTAAGLDGTEGAERRDEAVDAVSEWLDGVLVWGWLGPLAPVAELLDGPLCDLIAGAAVDAAYRALRLAESGHGLDRTIAPGPS